MDFVDKVKDIVEKGAVASKNAFEKAGTAVQDFSDKSILKIEIKQLESKINNNYKKLGKIVCDAFLSGTDTVSVATGGVKEIIDEIKSINSEIEKKQASLQEDK